MQLPLQISARNCKVTPASGALIRRRARKLDSFHGRIMGCRVLVETPHRHMRQGLSYDVRIDLTLPGGELVVRKSEREMKTAVQGAFRAAERRLKDYAQVQRGVTKTSKRRSALPWS